MKTLFRLQIIAAALIAALALGACDDDDDGPTGTGDTTGPTIGTITSMDSTHVNVRFSEQVDRESAETEANYTIAPVSIGNAVTVVNASLMSDSRTVVLTTTAMSASSYELTVTGVSDVRGNTMDESSDRTFTGKATADETAPQVVVREPSNNESNVALNAPITITFSEPVSAAVFNSSFALTSNGGDPVAVTVVTTDDVHFTVQPVAPLAVNTEYTISLVGVQDTSSNMMQDAAWNFHTSMTGTSTVTGIQH